MNKNNFTDEQLMIMNLYRTGSRPILISDLTEALPHVDDSEVSALMQSCIDMLTGITDFEFRDLGL